MSEIKLQYRTIEEKQALIEQHSNKYILEEQFLFDGNFLIFGEEPRPVVEIVYYTQIEKSEWNSLIQENANLLLNNATQEAKITSLEEENATILLELANLRGGTV